MTLSIKEYIMHFAMLNLKSNTVYDFLCETKTK